MKKYLIIFLFIIGCGTNQKELKNDFTNINFDNELSFEEFKIKLEDYANNNPFPNIDD